MVETVQLYKSDVSKTPFSLLTLKENKHIGDQYGVSLNLTRESYTDAAGSRDTWTTSIDLTVNESYELLKKLIEELLKDKDYKAAYTILEHYFEEDVLSRLNWLKR